MRFLVMHKASPQDEAGGPPPQKLIEEMGALIGEAAKNGIFLAGDGLLPSSKRHRVRLRGGKFTVARGPYEGESELPAAFAGIRVRSDEEGVEWAKRFAEAIGGDVNLEVGLMTEESDLMGQPRAADAPMRFLVIHQANAATEAGDVPTAANRPALAKLLTESARSGVLLFHETLLPSKEARRLLYRDNVRKVVDGPFSESKELVGGFCMLQMRSFDEVADFSNRFARIVGGTVEIDLRRVADAPGGGAR
jgi:hypothetical protein